MIYWQAKEISRVVRWCQPEDDTIDVALLEHVSPIEWDNVIPVRAVCLGPRPGPLTSVLDSDGDRV